MLGAPTFSQIVSRLEEVEQELDYLWDASHLPDDVRFPRMNRLLREKERLRYAKMMAEGNYLLARNLGLVQ